MARWARYCKAWFRSVFQLVVLEESRTAKQTRRLRVDFCHERSCRMCERTATLLDKPAFVTRVEKALWTSREAPKAWGARLNVNDSPLWRCGSYWLRLHAYDQVKESIVSSTQEEKSPRADFQFWSLTCRAGHVPKRKSDSAERRTVRRSSSLFHVGLFERLPHPRAGGSWLCEAI